MKITKDNIPKNLHSMVEVIGMEKFLEVSKMYGGTSVYIPVYERVTIGHRDRAIVREYNGRNLEKLRGKYKLTNQQLRRIIAKGKER